MSNSFRYSCLYIALNFAFVAQVFSAPQNAHSKRVPMWIEARKPAAKGTHVPVPQPILDELAADPDDCADPTPGQTTKMDAYRVQNGSETLIAVRGRSSCFCSPTGNCEFWVYRSRRGKYEIILHADTVNDFGFLKDKTSGYRDLVLWSHDSAQRTPAQLLLFDRNQYREACGWEEEYEFRELPDGKWVPNGGPKIVRNGCDAKSTQKQGEH